MPRLLGSILTVMAVLLVLARPGQAEDLTAYVINTTGESLSRINFTTGQVDNDIATLGSDILSYPNQIIVTDTMAYVLNSGTDEIQRINLNSHATAGFVSTGAGSNPYWMELYDDRYLYVTLLVDNALVRLDLDDGTIDDSWPVGPSPEGLLIHNHKVFVAVTAFNQSNWTYGQGRLAVFDTKTESFVADIPVGKNPQYLARDRLGRLHVVCTGDYVSSSGMIYLVDPSANVVLDSLAIGGTPGTITIGPDDLAYIAAGGWVSDGQVYSYDAITLAAFHDALNPLAVDSGCMIVVAHQDTSCLVGSFKDFVKSIDSAGTTAAAYAVGDGPVNLDFKYRAGDINGDGSGPDISDLILLVSYMFQEGRAPWPLWRTNVDGNLASADIADLIYLVSFMFQDGPPPKLGPKWVTP